MRKLTVLVAVLLPLGIMPCRAADEPGVEFYEKKVRPILVEHCYQCHGPDKQEGNLQVDSVASMLRGGDQGPAIVPGDPNESLLVKGVRYDDVNFQMPPKGKLAPEKVAALEQWIRQGAPAPADDQRKTASAPAKKFDLSERAKHWCFQPLSKTAPPQVRNRAWPRGDIDRYILQKLEAANLPPAPQAEPHELIRRLYFDLTGLPPTSNDVVQFVSACSSSPEAKERAYAALVDHLLASSQFGERWARHWLDLVRYAETRGHEFDYLIPNAYQYRDYVIRAFNADVPYDRFVVEHLAGDLLPRPRLHPKTGGNESILGTGFWFLGEECHSPVDIRQDETDRIDNKIDVMSKTFLGLTLACARCHDHKFDALSTKDYYAMSGFVLGMSYRQAAFDALDHNRRIYDAVAKLEMQHRSQLLEAQGLLMRPVLEKLPDYLSAVRDVAVELYREGKKADRTAVLTAVAKRYEVEEKRLVAWVEEAQRSTSDRNHPLHGLIGPADTKPTTPAVPGITAAPPPRVIVDYRTLKQADWLADGVSFGSQPVHPGDLQIGTDGVRPIERIFHYSAAVRRPKWEFFRTPENWEAEPGRLKWQQAGRSLKTPTFTLGSDKLWYLVRGSGHVYAAVASHRMNNGPLHGALAKSFEGPDQFRWIQHDLSNYAGHRVELEFSPFFPSELKEKSSEELALVCIVESEREPSGDLSLWISMPPGSLGTAVEFTSKLTTLLQQAALSIGRDDLAQNDQTGRRRIAVAAWIVEHPELWCTPSPKAAELVKPFFDQQAALLAQVKRTSQTAPAAWEGSAVDEYVLLRGNHRTTGDLVPRRFLEAIDGTQPAEYRNAGGRLALAERLVDQSDPLPARVMVNRLWQHMFGRGLVRTVDNFGSMGEPPTHPELLDHLARKFMDEGWSIKRRLRELALSQTYRMSSRVNKPPNGTVDPATADPENKLRHRADVKRLEAEAIRDAMLAVSGRLDGKQFGPSVEVYLTPFMEGRGRPQSGPLDGAGRRSIYLRVRRNFLNPMFQAFDYPTPFTSVGRRSVSNVPSQALSLMNGPLVGEQARRWAERALKEGPADANQRIDRLYLDAFARAPMSAERAAAQEFLAEQRKSYDAESADDPRLWADLCHVLFNVKEFIYIP